MTILSDEIQCKISPEPNSGCWLWMGTVNNGGYGLIDGLVAHKIIYKLLVGEVPAGLDLDHLCRVRSCVNPDHLEPVTRSENCTRGLTGHHMKARQATKTHCPKGHPYDEQNTGFRQTGRKNPFRVCLACSREKGKAYYARNSETILRDLRARYVRKADRT